MEPLAILQEVFSLSQVFGGTLKNHTAMSAVTNLAGIGQFILGFFLPGSGGGDAAAILQAQQQLESDIDQLGTRIEQDLKTTTMGTYFANVSGEQDWLQKKFADFDPTTGAYADQLTADDYTTKILPQLNEVFGPSSRLVAAWTWASQNEDPNYSTLSLYLTATTLYLNYAQFAASLDWWFACQKYITDNANHEADPKTYPNAPTVPVMGASFKQSETLTSLGPTLDSGIAYLSLRLNAINRDVQARQEAMNSAIRMSVNGTTCTDSQGSSQHFSQSDNAWRYAMLLNSKYRWDAYRSQTDSAHLSLLTLADIKSLNDTIGVLLQAQKDYHALVGTPCPAVTYAPPNVPPSSSTPASSVTAEEEERRAEHESELLDEWRQKHGGATPFFDIDSSGNIG